MKYTYLVYHWSHLNYPFPIDFVSSYNFDYFWLVERRKTMKVLFAIILLSTQLFSIGGIIVLNDGTTIEGNVSDVRLESITITPLGLSFPEEVRMENVDSLKMNDGKLMVAGNRVITLYTNGQFINPDSEAEGSIQEFEDYDVEYVIIPNWSSNLYIGYPIIRSNSLSDQYYDSVSPVIGLSVGSPYGLFVGDFFMNVIGEIAYYKFTKESGEANVRFDGFAFQLGLSPGFFIGDASISLTACTGRYHAGTGFIGGGSYDFPIGDFIMERFGGSDLIDNMEETIQSLELRLTSRVNIVQKSEGGATYWMDLGASIGYEF